MKLSGFIRRFLHLESSGGIIMLAAAATGIALANSPYAEDYFHIAQTPIHGVTFAFPFSLKALVNDGLMVLFFLLVALELKREMLAGFLQDKSQRLLPLWTAAGGMLAPALIFAALNLHVPEHLAGWAIPSATDIAFAVCVLTLLGRRVPPSLKIFLLALAIYDDLGAILIIALFYSTGLNWLAVGGIVGWSALLYLMNRLGVSRWRYYFFMLLPLWWMFHEAGIHTTLAGVIVGMCIPMKEDGRGSPLQRAIRKLHPFVSYLVLPLFAFLNAGVHFIDLAPSALLDAVPLGVALGLIIGKPLGIGAAYLALTKLGKARLPEGASGLQFFAVSIIAGIGFTMSLFISLLAYKDPALRDQATLGILAGSFTSAILGYALLRVAKR